ncbi:MAG: TetR/AcrR family transcriptional regulator [Cohaesibacteraceae bacterium]|nr:TetR/AcrR family transcriptional regulator [Cohaesibacteraceae bacterium]
MVKRNKRDNRQKILDTARDLFSNKGFDGTSVDSICNTAGVNKALIYYYFRNKDDILQCLFREATDGLSRQEQDPNDDPNIAVIEKIGREIQYLADHSQTLSLMMMEALKQKGKNDYLFDLSAKIMDQTLASRGFDIDDPENISQNHKAMVHEFFTGILPVISFVALGDKFSERFDIDKTTLARLFLEVFEESHVATHVEPDEIGPHVLDG